MSQRVEKQVHIPLKEAALNIDVERGVIWLNTQTHCLLRICNVDKELLKAQLKQAEEFGITSIDLRMR